MGKFAPFQKFWSGGKEEARKEWRHAEGGPQKVSREQHIWLNFIKFGTNQYANFEHSKARISQLHTFTIEVNATGSSSSWQLARQHAVRSVGSREGTVTRPDYLVNRDDKKIEGPSEGKICTKNKK